MLEVIHPRCCGLDVHKETVVACVLCATGSPPAKAVRTFGTTSAQIVALGDWLAEHQVSHVAMESTGVYWKPIWNLLEERFALLLVNAAHVKAVPGRKTDVRDAEWLADLLQHGLLRPSFVPPRPQQALRDLTRHRAHLVGARSAEVNRLHKTLEGANLKLGSVVTDVMGVSGRAILDALAAGETDAAALADLAVGQVRRKRVALEAALAGRVDARHRLLLGQHLAHIDFLAGQIAALDTAIAGHLRADEDLVARLDEIPGVGRRTAEVLAAEVGTDVSRFPSADHLTSWAGVCPGQDESAGKRRSGRTRKGNRALRTALVEAAKAAGRSKETALGRRYRRLQPRLGTKKATVAIARQILEAVYYLIKEGTPYREPPPAPRGPLADRVDQQRHIQALQELGFHVILQPIAA
jgi:transposase